jgi:hypothetical protein
MPESTEIMNWIKQLAAEDQILRQAACEVIKTMGADAVPYLRSARGRPQYPKTEALRMLAVVGDDCEGQTREVVVETLQYIVKSRSKSTPTEEKAIAREALERWGLEVPEPPPVKVLTCHRCNRPSSSTTVRLCFLPNCNKAVCEEHAVQIDGNRWAWFCSEEHRKQALKNPSLLM